MDTSASSSSATSAGTLPMTGTPTMPAMSAGAAAPIVAHNYATVNVKSHIPFTLDLQFNYSKWAFFKSLCSKFGLRSHIDSSAPPRPDDPQWDAAECCVRG